MSVLIDFGLGLCCLDFDGDDDPPPLWLHSVVAVVERISNATKPTTDAIETFLLATTNRAILSTDSRSAEGRHLTEPIHLMKLERRCLIAR